MARGALCATSPDRKAVFRYDGGRWTQIDSADAPYRHFVGTPAGLVASYDYYGIRARLYQPIPQRWVSLFGATLDTATDDGIYAGTRHGVYRLDHGTIEHFERYGGEHRWSEVGGPASNIFGGAWGLLAVDPAGRRVSRFRTNSWTWQDIGTAGESENFDVSFAMTTETAYRLTFDSALARTRVDRYDGDGHWTTIDSPPLAAIHGGVWGLVGIHAQTLNLYHYMNVPEPQGPIDQWKQIGGPGAMFAVGDNTVYGLTPDRDAVYEYDPNSNMWNVIGGAAKQIAYCGGVDPLP